jgi:hypothetical protein
MGADDVTFQPGAQARTKGDCAEKRPRSTDAFFFPPQVAKFAYTIMSPANGGHTEVPEGPEHRRVLRE